MQPQKFLKQEVLFKLAKIEFIAKNEFIMNLANFAKLCLIKAIPFGAGFGRGRPARSRGRPPASGPAPLMT